MSAEREALRRGPAVGDRRPYVAVALARAHDPKHALEALEPALGHRGRRLRRSRNPRRLLMATEIERKFLLTRAGRARCCASLARRRSGRATSPSTATTGCACGRALIRRSSRSSPGAALCARRSSCPWTPRRAEALLELTEGAADRELRRRMRPPGFEAGRQYTVTSPGLVVSRSRSPTRRRRRRSRRRPCSGASSTGEPPRTRTAALAPRAAAGMTNRAARLRPFGTTIFTEMSALALPPARSPSPGFPDTNAPGRSSTRGARGGRERRAMRSRGQPVRVLAPAGGVPDCAPRSRPTSDAAAMASKIDGHDGVQVTFAHEGIAATMLRVLESRDESFVLEKAGSMTSMRATIAIGGATRRLVHACAPPGLSRSTSPSSADAAAGPAFGCSCYSIGRQPAGRVHATELESRSLCAVRRSRPRGRPRTRSTSTSCSTRARGRFADSAWHGRADADDLDLGQFVLVHPAGKLGLLVSAAAAARPAP